MTDITRDLEQFKKGGIKVENISTERAIEVLKSRSGFVSEMNIDAIISYKMAIEALGKQAPKSPVYRINYRTLGQNYWCPTCDILVLDWYKYCANCGQHLGGIENARD